MHKFEDLIVWQKAMKVVEDIYRLTTQLPKEEGYGLRRQMRRSAVSIVSNIAEGAGRNTDGEFRNFLGIANGSSNELYTQLVLSSRLGLIDKQNITSLIQEIKEIQKMNYSLIKSLK